MPDEMLKYQFLLKEEEEEKEKGVINEDMPESVAG